MSTLFTVILNCPSLSQIFHSQMARSRVLCALALVVAFALTGAHAVNMKVRPARAVV
jgi:hypothetical protein